VADAISVLADEQDARATVVIAIKITDLSGELVTGLLIRTA
jgi:hypothetical protein